ncbi:hypothetical protein Tco_0360327 [Tanacetum coccineum]
MPMVSPSDLRTLLETYGFLLKCLNRLVPVLEIKAVLYDHWAGYIKLLTNRCDYSIVKTLIPEFMGSLMGSLGIVNNTRSLVPPYSTYTRDHHDTCKPLLLMDIIACYILCLSQSNLGIDFSGLVDVIEDIDEWFEVFDGDMARRRWLVEYLMQKIEFDDEEASAKLFGVALVEHAKVELEDRRGTNEWCIKQLQLHEERGYIQRTICNTIESIISYRLLEDMLRVKSPHLLPAINLISNPREKGSNHYLADLNRAIDVLREFDVNNNDHDHGPLYFLRGQTLCLRGLCLYEEEHEAFIKDINEAMSFWSNNDFIYKDTRTLDYTTKLLLFVFDVVITSHNEDTHQLRLLEEILIFFKKSDSKAVGMLWQFKSHHSHLESEMIRNQFQSNVIEQCFVEHYGDLKEDGGSNNKLERMLSYIREKAGCSLKSACLLGHLYYDLSERMLATGSMTQALKGERVHAYLTNPIVAARAWSLTSEDFILPPNNNFICCLMSIHQEATILELMGNGIEALEVLKHGKTLSLQRCSSYFAWRFQAALESLKLIRKRKKGSDSRQRVTEDDLVSTERMLREELIKSKGPKDWERSCTFSLLSVLSEIGKDHIYNNRTMKAQAVFLDCINLVYNLSSLPQSHSQRKLSSFVDFFDFIEKSQIKFSCGTYVAHIIYMISWLAYKMSKDTRKTRVDLFSIPIEKLISSLKLALVLSSEVPELFQKVAQLLAIMYFVSDKEILSSKVKNLQWACFFQHLTVGSDVNYLFSHKLREVYGVSDPDNTLHRPTPSTDADLNEFVKKFFEDLQPHTILVINIIGNKYKDLLKMLEYSLPLDCVALMMLARFNSKSQPVIGLLVFFMWVQYQNLTNHGEALGARKQLSTL